MKTNMLQRYQNLSDSVKASIWFMICSVVQKGISFITIPIFTRIMSAEEYGQYSVFLSWENVIVIFASLNLSYQIFNNGMAKYNADKDGYTSSMVGLTLGASLVTCIVYCCFKDFFVSYMNLPSKYMMAMFLNMFLSAVIGLWSVRQRYEFKYKVLAAVTLASAFLNPMLGIILVGAVDDKVWARIISVTFVNMLFFCFVLINLLLNSKKFVVFSYWKYALKLDIPLLPHYLSMVLLNNSDRIMIDRFCGSASTAFYSMAHNVSMVMQIIVSSINSSFNPWLYHKLREENYKDIRKVTNLLLLAVTTTSMLPALFAPEILGILGSSEYRTAVNIVPVLSICVFMMYIYTLFSNIEMYYEKPQYIMTGSISATFFNIVLNFIFIQIWGYSAAAYTTLVCYVLLATFHYVMMQKICRERKLEEKIYNVKFIVLLSIGVLVVMFAVRFLYNYWILRYVLILIGISLILWNRKKIMTYLKKMKE